MICTTGDCPNTAITALPPLPSSHLNCSTAAHYCREPLQNIQLPACWPHTIVCCVQPVQPVSRSLPIRSSSSNEHCVHCLSCINMYPAAVGCRADQSSQTGAGWSGLPWSASWARSLPHCRVCRCGVGSASPPCNSVQQCAVCSPADVSPEPLVCPPLK